MAQWWLSQGLHNSINATSELEAALKHAPTFYDALKVPYLDDVANRFTLALKQKAYRITNKVTAVEIADLFLYAWREVLWMNSELHICN
jgi:hypothetical protein